VRSTTRSTAVTTITKILCMPPSRVAQVAGATSNLTTDARNALLRNSVGGHRQERGDSGDSADAQKLEGAA
jgi:hypothetical protein